MSFLQMFYVNNITSDLNFKVFPKMQNNIDK